MKSFIICVLIAISFPLASTLKITTVYTVDEGIPSDEVRAIVMDNARVAWIGTKNGFAWFSNGAWNKDLRETNPVINGVSTIFKDSKDNIWLGGLNECHVYDGNSYNTYSISKDMGIEGRVVFSYHEDPDQNIWTATTGGVSIFNGNTWRPFPIENGKENNVVHDIDQDSKGRFWFATRNAGLKIYHGNRWESYYSDRNCRKILRDDSNNMWVGTNNGLIKYDGLRWQIFEKGKTILPMFEGKKGLIWCIANGRDILRISQQGQTIQYNDPTQNLAGEIYQLEYDPNGTIWAATDHGLVLFN